LTSALCRTLLALLAITLAGCGGRPAGALKPVATTAEGAQVVEFLAATTRSPSRDNPDDIFSGERGAQLSFADVAISIPPAGNRSVGQVQWPKAVPGDPARDFVARRLDIIDLPAARKRFSALLSRPGINGKALVFVHGYNSRFDDAVFRFAQIIHDTDARVAPVLFTWPSRGQVLAYTYDRESVNYSRDALEGLLNALVANPAVSEVSVLAHSMGNWAIMETLRQMAIRNGRVPPKIRDVMLAAPDVDLDVFRTQMNAIGRNRPRMTLFVSQDDRALQVSRRIWGDVPRLGAIDPTLEPAKTLLEGVDVHDLTKLKSNDALAHGKFAQSPDIVRFIGRRLSEGQDLSHGRSELHGRLVSGASELGGTLGSVAGQVLLAPAAVLSPD
jgi:esterase/lipase superfamily enzyme